VTTSPTAIDFDWGGVTTVGGVALDEPLIARMTEIETLVFGIVGRRGDQIRAWIGRRDRARGVGSAAGSDIG